MAVRFSVFLLRRYTGGNEVVEVTGETVGQCVDDLLRKYPATRDVLLDRGGELHHAVEISVNGSTARPEGLARPVRDGDELCLLFQIGGGAPVLSNFTA